MEILRYLAMTAAEVQSNPNPDFPIGWMSCHFSPNNPGLSNVPTSLPPNSLLILDDSFPFQNHDVDTIENQLKEIISQFQIQKLLLDLQRPKSEEVEMLIAQFCNALPCSMAVTESYAEKSSCGVFLSPPPLHRTLKDHIVPWRGKEIWLELAPQAACYAITESGCSIKPDSLTAKEQFPHRDKNLHVSYRIEPSEDCVVFRLQRSQEELEKLVKEAENLGITTVIGLYQEFK